MVMVKEWNFTWPLLSPGANSRKAKIVQQEVKILLVHPKCGIILYLLDFMSQKTLNKYFLKIRSKSTLFNGGAIEKSPNNAVAIWVNMSNFFS